MEYGLVSPAVPADCRHSTETESFEFTALAEARNYRETLIKEFGKALQGNVIEIGAGIGQFTDLLRRMPQITRLLSIEPNPRFAMKFRFMRPYAELIEGTVANVPMDITWDSILSVNVLEHIEHDQAELTRYAELLSVKRGAICLFVPARPEIYARIDKDFGHYRRYTRPELNRKLEKAGFTVIRLHYFNFVGYFAWWLNFCLMRRRAIGMEKVRTFDQRIFPITHAIERRFMRPPVGQSLIAVARA